MTKVTLRKKDISGNRQSLYLDYYPPIANPETGKPTRREFLGLYLYNSAKKAIEKQENKDTEAIAENIRAKRLLEIQNRQFGFLSKDKLNANFIEYFKALAEKRKASNHDNWISAYHHLIKFSGGTLRFADLDERFCNDFKEYILKAPSNGSTEKTLSQNSAHGYFNKLKATLKQAYKDGLLQTDLNSKIDRIKEAETEKQFLTIEELNKLVKEDCAMPILKTAALFSALTGLRFSDIEKLTWGQVQHSETGGYYLQFRQKKTGGVEVTPISEQAFNLLGIRKEPIDIIFERLKYSAQTNMYLKFWLLKAGITKHITFHCFRHTYATLQLSLGTDIYTVSKMLGHREIRTTQVYAKVIDRTKQEAANKIKLDI
jgi:integrase